MITFWLGVLVASVFGVLVYRENRWPGATKKMLDRFKR